MPRGVESLGTDWQAKTMKALFSQGEREVTSLFLLPKHLYSESFAGWAQVLILYSLYCAWDSAGLYTQRQFPERVSFLSVFFFHL